MLWLCFDLLFALLCSALCSLLRSEPLLGRSSPLLGRLWPALGRSWGRSWAALGAVLLLAAVLGRSWAALGPLLAALGPLFGLSLALLDAVGRVWAALGTAGRIPRACRDPFCDDFGTLSGRFGDHLGRNSGTYTIRFLARRNARSDPPPRLAGHGVLDSPVLPVLLSQIFFLRSSFSVLAVLLPSLKVPTGSNIPPGLPPQRS